MMKSSGFFQLCFIILVLFTEAAVFKNAAAQSNSQNNVNCRNARAICSSAVGDLCSACKAAIESGCIDVDAMAAKEEKLSFLNKSGDPKDSWANRLKQCKMSYAGEAKRTKTASCDVDEKILAIEKEGERVAYLGELLKKVIFKDLPEYPDLEYKVKTSGPYITVNIEDPDSYMQKFSSLTNTTLYFIGLFTDVPPVYHLEQALGVDGSKLTNYSGKAAILSITDYLTEAGHDYKTGVTSTGGEVVQFVKDTTAVIANVDQFRTKLICTVKNGMPEFYRQYDNLNNAKKSLIAEIKSSQCPQTYLDVVGLKVKPANSIYLWHAEGIMGPGNPERTGWVQRKTWLEKDGLLKGKPAIFSTVNCEIAPAPQ